MEGYVYKRAAVLFMFLMITIVIWGGNFSSVSYLDFSFGSKAEVLGVGKCPSDLLCVAFLDVGQGDSILIQSPSGQQMLVDGGRDSSVLRELPSVIGVFDRTLDYVLMTHPDADHVGGLVGVLERYKVMNIIRTENESQTDVWETAESLSVSEDADIYFARRGQIYDLGSGVFFEILFPDVDVGEVESNAASIIGKLVYGDTSFIFTGDSPKNIEEYLVVIDGEYLKSDVLKVGHHGSRTSTSEIFLNEVSPDYAVISAGEDNGYGHPHVEVTDVLFNSGVEVLNTAKNETIIFVSDGSVLEVI